MVGKKGNRFDKTDVFICLTENLCVYVSNQHKYSSHLDQQTDVFICLTANLCVCGSIYHRVREEMRIHVFVEVYIFGFLCWDI